MIPQAIVSGPHAHSKFSVAETMASVMACLTPATCLGFYQFGWPAILLFSVTVLSALVFEGLCLAIAGRPVPRFLFDGSAALTGWLLAMTLPPWAPWWVGTVGAFIAIVIGKHVYGGLGQNLFNPAMVARAMLLIALPVPMTIWVLPDPMGAPGAPGLAEAMVITFGGGGNIDAVSGATTLGFVSAGLDGGRTLTDIMPETAALKSLFFGHVAGSLGETSALLLLGGGLLLIAMRVIRWQTPVAVLGSVAALSGGLHLIDPATFASPLWHLTSGGLMLCAFFIATDYVTSPISGLGQLVYGAGTGLLIVLIRTWGAFPEGAAFAVLLMNACTPLIDTWTRPRIFGRDRKGRPLEIPQGGRP
ncbi:RnfABCDGE type electron transport complex subunit D [Tropicimonas isoalkanivorans]|uniref:Ion-translocating oxidoreductase complex subunit D n=1 Tax=Tropicimonas isoalkanivorans TaxID=441112 RepID=A0A1I1H892_9RHOB|nr:RnfABCDGE type electron transport complex subunit D [Tropicimonas isoalkanivorans]SFC20174.1 electron transport complex protein RnfD [Tropicimonas isoalkanivorans]